MKRERLREGPFFFGGDVETADARRGVAVVLTTEACDGLGVINELQNRYL